MSQGLQCVDPLETQDKPWCRSSLQVGKDAVPAGRQAGGAPPKSRGGSSLCPTQAFSGLGSLHPRHGKNNLPHLVYRFKCYSHPNTLIDKPRITFDQMSGCTSPSQVDRLNPMSQGCTQQQGHVAARIFLHHCIHAAQPERSL